MSSKRTAGHEQRQRISPALVPAGITPIVDGCEWALNGISKSGADVYRLIGNDGLRCIRGLSRSPQSEHTGELRGAGRREYGLGRESPHLA